MHYVGGNRNKIIIIYLEHPILARVVIRAGAWDPIAAVARP